MFGLIRFAKKTVISVEHCLVSIHTTRSLAQYLEKPKNCVDRHLFQSTAVTFFGTDVNTRLATISEQKVSRHLFPGNHSRAPRCQYLLRGSKEATCLEWGHIDTPFPCPLLPRGVEKIVDGNTARTEAGIRMLQKNIELHGVSQSLPPLKEGHNFLPDVQSIKNADE